MVYANTDELGEFRLRFDSDENLQLRIGTRQQKPDSHSFVRDRDDEIGRRLWNSVEGRNSTPDARIAESSDKERNGR